MKIYTLFNRNHFIYGIHRLCQGRIVEYFLRVGQREKLWRDTRGESTLTLSYNMYHFWQKRCRPLSYTVYWKMVPRPLYARKSELCIPLKYCKCTASLIRINHNEPCFLVLFTAQDASLLALILLPLQTDMTDYPRFSYTSTNEFLITLSYYPKWNLTAYKAISDYTPTLRLILFNSLLSTIKT